jgi:hypothetical protein
MSNYAFFTTLLPGYISISVRSYMERRQKCSFVKVSKTNNPSLISLTDRVSICETICSFITYCIKPI